MTAPGPDWPAFTVLFVCTGNICRSALAERLGRGFLDERLGEAADAVHLVSAGTRAVVGSAMHPDSALVLQGYGVAAGDFRARQLADGMPSEADLILTMTRDHRRDVLRVAPRAMQRTFTLREATDLLHLLGADMQPVGDTLPERARALVKEMAAARSRRHGGPDDDVQDPISRPLDVHEAVGEIIVTSLLPLLDRIADLHRDPTGVSPSGTPLRPPRGARPVEDPGGGFPAPGQASRSGRVPHHGRLTGGG